MRGGKRTRKVGEGCGRMVAEAAREGRQAVLSLEQQLAERPGAAATPMQTRQAEHNNTFWVPVV